MGWDVEGGTEEAHPQEALEHGRGGPGQSGLSPEQGAPGHPQAQKLRAPGAAVHEPLRALLGMLGLTGDLGISQLAQQGDTTPRSAKASSQRGWGRLSHSVPTGTHP